MMLVDIFNQVIRSFKPLFDWGLNFLVRAVVICFAPFLTACAIYFVYYNCFKKVKRKPSHLGTYKVPNLLYMLFVLLPKRIVLDYLTLDPDTFKEYGFYMVVGEQGTGKSMTMAYLLRKWQTIYKKLIVISNMGYKYETTKLVDLSQLSLKTGNGIYGEVDVIDEVQTVLGTEFSLKFPEYFKEINCQQRKMRRCILGGTQNFDQVAKPIRQQCRYIFFPKTYFGCFTVVKQYKCKLDKDGQLITDSRNRPLGTFCFVHDEFLRNAYNSYDTIDKIKI